MNFALTLTLDGMVRALRMKAHELGDDPAAAFRRETRRNTEALALLGEESRRLRLEAGDEFGG